MDADPQLTDSAHIGVGSPCIDTGSGAFCSGTDIDSEAWRSPTCMGCDQFVAETASYFLTVVSPLGGACPAGATNRYGTAVDAWVTPSPIESGATQYVCVGASVVGNAFTQNSATNVSLTLTNNATLTWLWQTNYWLATAAEAHGAVSVGSGWQAANASTQLTACAELYYHLDAWTGDASGAENPLSLLMDRPRAVAATFAADMTATHPTPHWWLAQYGFATDFELAAQADADRDNKLTWEEFVAGTVPTNGESVFRALIDVSNGVSRIAWTPDLGAARVYAVEGKASLDAGAWAPTNAASRFFRVRVSLP